jgi:TRAP-type C4-dicarboxylate transport system substrate-binding protein
MIISRRRFLAASAAVPLFAPSLALAQAREFRLGLITPDGHSWNRAALKLAAQLKAETRGRLTMTVFDSGQLGNEAAMMQQLQSGSLDIGFIQAAELGSRVPHIAAINAPYIVRSTPAVAKFVRHPVAIKLFDVLPKETGTIGLGWGITGMRAIFSARDLQSIGDIKGMKLRINPTPAFRDFYQSLGATPTPIPTPAVFDAMSNGQVDGLEADLDLSWNQRFDRVSKMILQMNAVFMPMAAIVSGRVWQSLSAADKELITTAMKKTLDEQIDELAGAEPALIENFRKAPIPIRQVATADTEAVIANFDKIWLPKAPVLAELRKVGATI